MQHNRLCPICKRDVMTEPLLLDAIKETTYFSPLQRTLRYIKRFFTFQYAAVDETD